MAGIGTLTKAQAAKTLLGLVPHISVENLVRASRFAEKLTRVERDKAVIRALRELFEQEHPAVLMAKDVMERLSPNVRRKIIENLFVNAFLIGTDKREIEMPKKEGFKPPMFVVISPTMRCNLRCPGCYAGEYEQHQGLSTELVDRIITEAKSMGTYFITMSGGEIFMRPDMFDIWQEHNDVFFQLYTNGTMIDAKMARRLEECGNVAPMISLEGFRERTDARRGPGTFDRVFRAMDHLREAGVLFGTSFTETRENMEEIASDEIIDLLVDKGALVAWYFQYIPIGREPHVELMPTPEQRDWLRRRLLKLRDEKAIFIGDFWNDGYYVEGCIAAGREYLHINANGDVEPCVFCHFAVDNIRDKSLKEALNSDFMKAIRREQPYRDNYLTPCMLIDEPTVLRQAVARHHAYPTHSGAETLITSLKDEIDAYASSYRAIADEVWDKEYAEKSGRRVKSARYA
ncbi:MAG: radical SAM protein [Candidatus Eisenbacteria bacterium]|nr:radical SAM protein [Candidatus Eisenbacteria bacterium]